MPGTNGTLFGGSEMLTRVNEIDLEKDTIHVIATTGGKEIDESHVCFVGVTSDNAMVLGYTKMVEV